MELWAASGLILAGALLAAAVGFAVAAVRRTRLAEEGFPGPPAPPAPGTPVTLTPPRVASGLWAGALSTGVAGFLLMSGIVTVLLGILLMPSYTLTTPATAGGLHRDTDPFLQMYGENERERLRRDGVPNPVTAFYRDPLTGGPVTFTGGSGEIPDPERALTAALRGASTPFAGAARLERYPAGPLEGELMCLQPLNYGDADIGVCGWADATTLGVIVAFDRSPEATAAMLLAMRSDMEQPAR
ncbi:MAG: hypothetical protein GEV11_25865 [Streptosporangiales bacterium]|nr:hypothetical protein [Streptosporangiales bacterium]